MPEPDHAAEAGVAHGSLDCLSVPRMADGLRLTLSARIGWLAAHRPHGARSANGQREFAAAQAALDRMGVPAGDLASRVLRLSLMNHEAAAAVLDKGR